MLRHRTRYGIDSGNSSFPMMLCLYLGQRKPTSFFSAWHLSVKVTNKGFCLWCVFLELDSLQWNWTETSGHVSEEGAQIKLGKIYLFHMSKQLDNRQENCFLSQHAVMYICLPPMVGELYQVLAFMRTFFPFNSNQFFEANLILTSIFLITRKPKLCEQ